MSGMGWEIMKLDVFPLLQPERLEEMKGHILNEAYQPDAEIDPGQSCSKGIVAFALAMLEKEGSPQPYSEGSRQLLEVAQRSLLLAQQALRGKEDNPDLVDILKNTQQHLGLVDIELFKIKAREGAYEEALIRLTDGLLGLFEPVGDYETGEVTVEFEYQEAVDCFQRLRDEPHRVRDWENLAEACRILTTIRVLYGCGPEEEVKGSEIYPLPWEQYWSTAQGFAESRLSPDEYRRWKEREEQEHAEKHMEQLFFPGVWQQLPELARDALIQTDVAWWSKSKSSKSAVVDNLWKASGQMIKGILWEPFLEYLRLLPIKDPLTVKIRDLQTKPGWEPGLGDFLALMWQHQEFLPFLESLGVLQEKQRFVGDARKQLAKLNRLRKKSVHPSEGEKLEPGDIGWAYQTFLGLGCAGTLSQLANLKTSVPPT